MIPGVGTVVDNTKSCQKMIGTTRMPFPDIFFSRFLLLMDGSGRAVLLDLSTSGIDRFVLS